MEELNPAFEGYASARESALEQVWRGLHEAEAQSDWEAFEYFNSTINVLTAI